MRRTRYSGLIRNALVAAGNTRDAGLTRSIRRHLESADPLIAEHARWALGQLSP
jgi:epoxyqueuosine reductase